MLREARASRGRSPSRDRARPGGARRSARRAVRSAQGHRIRPLRLRSRGAGALGGVALVRQRGPARPGERDAQGAVRRPGGAGQPARAALARLPPRRAGRPHPRGGGGALLRRRAAALRGAAAPRRGGLLQRAGLLRSRRDSPVWRAQAEGRWASGPFSAWARADLGTSSEVRYAAVAPQGVQATSDQRSDVEAHLRWAERGSAAGVRVTARRLDAARTEQGAESALRRGFAYARAYLLAPVLPRLALRAVALGWRERARGLDAGARYGFSRWDLGGRLGAVWTPLEEWTFEAGYVRIHSAQELAGASLDQWGDKAYGTARWAPRERVRLHFLISHQVTTGGFGGFSGGLEVIF